MTRRTWLVADCAARGPGVLAGQRPGVLAGSLWDTSRRNHPREKTTFPSWPGPDPPGGIRIEGGCNSLGAAREGAFIDRLAGLGDPAFKVEGDGAIDGDPLAIVFAGNVNVRSCGRSALAGGETKHVTPSQPLAKPGLSI